jgi:hypothetical protein
VPKEQTTHEVRTRDRRGRRCCEAKIVEDAPRPTGPYSHAVVAYCFLFVAPRAFLDETAPTWRSLPLYGAPYRGGLYGWRLAPIEDRLDGFPEVVCLHGCWVVVVVVHRAVVA